MTWQYRAFSIIIGVRLLLYNGSTVSNNSIVDFEDLPIGVALLCSTDRKIGFNASWASPAGNQATAIFDVNSGASVLQMERMASPIQPHHNGIWHCEIPDWNYNMQYIFVGLYSQGKTTPLPLHHMQGVQYFPNKIEAGLLSL